MKTNVKTIECGMQNSQIPIKRKSVFDIASSIITSTKVLPTKPIALYHLFRHIFSKCPHYTLKVYIKYVYFDTLPMANCTNLLRHFSNSR